MTHTKLTVLIHTPKIICAIPMIMDNFILKEFKKMILLLAS